MLNYGRIGSSAKKKKSLRSYVQYDMPGFRPLPHLPCHSFSSIVISQRYKILFFTITIRNPNCHVDWGVQGVVVKTISFSMSVDKRIFSIFMLLFPVAAIYKKERYP